MQGFKKKPESFVQFGSRLESSLCKAIKQGHSNDAAKESILFIIFWTGLKEVQPGIYFFILYIVWNMHDYDVHQAFYHNCEIHGLWVRGSGARAGQIWIYKYKCIES